MKMMAVSAIAQSGAVMSDILEASDWLYSFFSNISYHLESSRWGNRFPVLLCEFCDRGVVEYDHLDKLERAGRRIQRSCTHSGGGCNI